MVPRYAVVIRVLVIAERKRYRHEVGPVSGVLPKIRHGLMQMRAACARSADFCKVVAVALSLSGSHDTGVLLEVEIVAEFTAALCKGHEVGRPLASVRTSLPDVRDGSRR